VLRVVGLAVPGYVARHFSIHTAIRDLISADLPWVQRAIRYDKEFPPHGILVILDAPTPEIADQSAITLAESLRADTERFRAVNPPATGHSFTNTGYVILVTQEIK